MAGTRLGQRRCLQQQGVFAQVASALAIERLDAESTREGLSDVTALQTARTVIHGNTHENLVVKGASEFCSSKLSWQRAAVTKTFPPSV